MSVSSPLALVVLLYVVALFGIAWRAQREVHDHQDFLVAGRRLPLLLAWPTLVATWFGAGTLLTATDEVRRGGLEMAALDPLGAGACLLLAGWWIAAPLWRMKLLTLSDFFEQRFGPRAEQWSALLMVPTYFGWIAAQFVALAGLLDLVLGLDPHVGILVVAVVGTAYTLMGGMWSVTLTDAAQMALVVLGLVWMAGVAFTELGSGSIASGLGELLARTPPEKLAWIPTESLAAAVGWLGVLAVGSLGNLPGQDLVSRIFASRSERTAVWACHLSGATYLVVGLLPLGLGLAAELLVPGQTETSTLALLARALLDPITSTVFILVVLSAVLSTIDSALLSPASVLAQNLFAPWLGTHRSDDLLRLNRVCVLVVAAASAITAYAGESAYSLLESAYELGLVSLLVPLLRGIRSERGDERACLGAMLAGTFSWGLHTALGWESFANIEAVALPVAPCSAALAWLAYEALARRPRSD